MDGHEHAAGLPVPAPETALTAPSADSALTSLERDYLMVAIFVRIQHLQFDEARTLITALIAAGEKTPDLLFARAVVENALADHEAALNTVRELERLAPAVITAKSKVTRRTRMRAYIKARATFALAGELDEEGRAALDFYLRHGQKKTKRKSR